MPTFLIVISESGVIKPATMKNAAEEMSPGTFTFTLCSSLAGSIGAFFLCDLLKEQVL